MNLASAAAVDSVLALGEPSNQDREPHGKLRSACDRCHSQKLRCVRRNDQSCCRRCYKLRTICKFSARSKRSSIRPAKVSVRKENASAASLDSFPILHDDDIEVLLNDEDLEGLSSSAHAHMYTEEQQDQNFDFTQYDACLNGPTFVAGPSEGDLGTLTLPSSSPAFANLEQDYRNDNDNHYFSHRSTSLVHKLANLNIALHECASNLPAEGDHPEREVPAGQEPSRKQAALVIDKMFQLTNEFTSILESLFSGGDIVTTLDDSGFPNMEHSQVSFRDLDSANTLDSISRHSRAHVSEADMLMVMSCHCRLAEIYLSVFNMMQSCLKHLKAPYKDTSCQLILPKMQLGSFAAYPTLVDRHHTLPKMASSMYMVMITMLSTQHWNKLASLFEAEVSTEGVEDGDSILGGFQQDLRFRDVHESEHNDFMSSLAKKTRLVLSTIEDTRRLIILHL